LLSKSKYTSGLQCPRLLWFKCRKPSELPPVSEMAKMKFEQGSEIGVLAQSLFADGITINHDNFMGGITSTQNALYKRLPIFEAALHEKNRNLYSRADILAPGQDESWNIYEVKSAASLKSEYIDDIAFQKYVYQACGLTISNCSIIHINTKYSRQGEIIPSELFKIENVDEKVESLFPEIEANIDWQNQIIGIDSAPPIQLGTCCSHPYDCPLKEKCWSIVPPDSVFDLSGGHRLPSELWKQGIAYLKDIPLEYPELSEKQKNQIMAYRQQQPIIQREKIAEWLDGLKYPLYYLDFETYDTSVPLFDGSHPYQKIPFQFSLHIQNNPEGPVEHISYLADGRDDNRNEISQKLQENLGDHGSIVVYFDQFEKKVIRELSELFPFLNEWAQKTIERIVDLMDPFALQYYHSHLQKGSNSIKKVLPSITDLSYKDLSIENGEQASFLFTRIVLGKASEEEEKQTRADLIDYCRLDTLAMVEIVRSLYKIARGEPSKNNPERPKPHEQLKFQLDI